MPLQPLTITRLTVSLSLCLPLLACDPSPSADAGQAAAEEVLEAGVVDWLDRCYPVLYAEPAASPLASVDPTLENTLVLPDPEEHRPALRDFMLDTLRSPHVVIHEEAARSCAVELETLPCDSAMFSDPDSPCGSAISGTLDEGAACVSFECNEGLLCEADPEGGCGTCVSASGAGLGESCGSWGCAEGLAHHYAADGCTCEVPAALGEACIDTFTYERIAPCVVDAECSYVTGVCTALGQEGDSCADVACDFDLVCNTDGPSPLCEAVASGETAGDACSAGHFDACGNVYETGLACVGEDGIGTCVQITGAELDGRCTNASTYDNSSSEWCKDGLSTAYCDYDEVAGEGVCRPRPTSGEACDYWTPCEHTASCEYAPGGYSGVCTPLPVEGEACTESGFCAPDTWCVSGTCVSASFFFYPPTETESCWEDA